MATTPAVRAATVEDGVLLEAARSRPESRRPTPATPARRDEDEGAAATTAAGATEAAGTVGAAPDTTGAPGTTTTASVLVIRSPEELTEFASVALFATTYAAPADSARPTCDEVRGRWLGPAMYVDDGVETPVEVFLVAAAGEVRAVDAATCAVIATAPAP